MYTVPLFEECIDFAKAIFASNLIEVKISPREHDVPFQCHKNCEFNPVLGYYFVKDSHNILHAFKHSVLNFGDQLIDVTPTIDERAYNVFCYGTKYTQEHLTYVENSVFINKEKEETELMYYVYGLIDPRNNQIFYIGKGKDNRALSHFTEQSLKREGNTKKAAKIKKLKALGYQPMIEFYAQNIDDENIAYKIEADLIKKYGRIGFEKNGILTNICEDNRPPSHKGKTYKQIYGEAAEEQRVKRHKLQLKAGGWFKGHKHSDESRKLLSQKSKGENNARYGIIVKGTETAKKIGEKNKGKKHYDRYDVKLLYIEGLDKYIYSNELYDFCKSHGYSWATFYAQLKKNWPTSRKGLNKGLCIRYATEQEIQSINVDMLKGLSL